MAVGLLTAWAIKTSRGHKMPVCVTPADYGLHAQDVTLTTEDNITLEGWFIAAPHSTKTILLVHGFGMNKGEVLKRTYYLADQFNLFYLDCRGAGDSEGRSEAGLKESKDIHAAVLYLQRHHPQQAQELGLYGISMGSAAAAYYTATYGGIKCLVLESSYFSFKNVAKRWMWKHAKVPYFPLVASMVFWKEHTMGQKVETFAPNHTAPQITCPVLMIQGELDKLTPAKKAQKTYRLLPGPKELWVVPRAGHLSCYQQGGTQYRTKLQQFFRSHL